MADTQAKTIQVDEANPIQHSYTYSTQSANSLFRFFGKLDYLLGTIEKSAMIPRYYPETVDYLNIGIHHIAYPMVCFCDINLHKMTEHISMYGGYGIAFSKDWGIRQGIQPMHYVNPESLLCKDFSAAFLASICAETVDEAQNYLLSQMYFLKPISGTMLRDGNEQERIFTDECEWRYIPNVQIEQLPQAVTDAEQFSIDKALNKTLLLKNTCWLNFTYSDVKYIILQADNEFKTLCDLLDRVVDDISTKKKLLSKVIIWEDSRGDF